MTDMPYRVYAGDPLAAKLKRIRIERGICPKALASIAGYSLVTLCEWESGRKWPSRRSLNDWCQALGYELTVVPRDATLS